MMKEWYNWVFETEIVKSVRNTMRETVNYGITAKELSHLMEYRGMEAVEHLEKMGGILGLCQKLDVSIYEGLLSADDIKQRKKVFGSNRLIAATSKTLLSLMWEALKEKTLIMLEVCAFISLVLSFYNPSHRSDKDLDENPWLNRESGEHEQKYGFVEAVAIFFSIVLTVLVMAFSEYSKEAKFRALQNRLEKEHKINVLRFGTIIEIPTSELVVGDICVIKYGDVIPADGILFECNELRVDESSLTGESDLVNKQPDKDITLYAGTHVMEGSGRMIVVAVGDHSQTGLIYALMKSGQNGKSILQCKLADLAVKIGYFGMSVAAITIVMLVTRSCIIDFAIERQKLEYRHFKEFFNHVITGITILVVAVPEGLPLAVTLSLAYSVKQMMKDNNLVRHIDACETMGNATTICSDKTGTLTANRMTAVQCYLCGVYYTQLSKRRIGIREDIADILAQNIALNSASTSRVVKDENNQIKQYGNKTECALLGLLHKLKYDYVQVRNEFPEKNFHRVFSFNSTRKLMRTIIKLPDDKGFRLLAKGASEMILKKCSFIVGKFGQILKLTQAEKDQIDNKILKVMGKNGLRVIILSYLDYYFENPGNDPARRVGSIPVNCKLMKNNVEPDWEAEESYSDMTCLAVVGIEDPIKKDVPQAIRMCQKSGISVKMITGDNIDTARSIAIKCGIISDGPDTDLNDKTILESKEYNRIIRNEAGEVDQDRFDQVWPHLKVLARSTPMDKYILVKHIIESNIKPIREVVAVTGDGTNDAPALKIADVGFAMGITGTEVAKEASDIILTDDNFSSIVKAVIWGRNVYDSIAKFIQFQLTVNIVAVMICFISSCVIQESPLRPVQMLWVNLIMDTLGSLSLSTEQPSKVLLLRKPYGRNKSLISNKMLLIILLNSAYQLTVLVVFLFWGCELFDFDSGIRITKYSPVPNVHFTMLFNIFVMMTLFNEINSRKINLDRNVFEGVTTNWVFCTIFFTTFITQVLIVQFGNIIFTTYPLNLSQWIWSLAFGVSQLVWGQIVTSISLCHPSPPWCQKLADLYG